MTSEGHENNTQHTRTGTWLCSRCRRSACRITFICGSITSSFDVANLVKSAQRSKCSVKMDFHTNTWQTSTDAVGQRRDAESDQRGKVGVNRDPNATVRAIWKMLAVEQSIFIRRTGTDWYMQSRNRQRGVLRHCNPQKYRQYHRQNATSLRHKKQWYSGGPDCC